MTEGDTKRTNLLQPMSDYPTHLIKFYTHLRWTVWTIFVEGSHLYLVSVLIIVPPKRFLFLYPTVNYHCH